jgi:hypothetical protein
VSHLLRFLAEPHSADNRHATLHAWRDMKKTLADTVGDYQERENGLGKDLPTSCVEVTTCDGSTLLAAQILDLLHETILQVRNGAGLVLCKCEWGHDDYSLKVENLPKPPKKPRTSLFNGLERGDT